MMTARTVVIDTLLGNYFHKVEKCKVKNNKVLFWRTVLYFILIINLTIRKMLIKKLFTFQAFILTKMGRSDNIV